MNGSFPRIGLFAMIAFAACSSATRVPVATGVEPGTGNQAILTPATQARTDGARPPHTAADVHFMSGMIGHHAQAVLMAGWAVSHGAGPEVRRLCERIVVGQRDEIALMQGWLQDRGEPVPDGDPAHQMMPGMAHPKLMPGMLTAEQLGQLDRARGAEFDRLFLRFMIQHHEGAITMVDQLLGSVGGGQDDTVFKLASDVYADQTTEIDFMSKMLAAMAP
jgi:uncharacterized protein (DUF305 family)